MAIYQLNPIELSGVVVGKPVHALCSIDGKTDRLKARYLAIAVTGGRTPLWAVWTAHGNFRRHYTTRTQVEAAYPNLIWRRMSARLGLNAPVVDESTQTEGRRIRDHYDALAKRKKGGDSNVVPLAQGA